MRLLQIKVKSIQIALWKKSRLRKRLFPRKKCFRKRNESLTETQIPVKFFKNRFFFPKSGFSREVQFLSLSAIQARKKVQPSLPPCTASAGAVLHPENCSQSLEKVILSTTVRRIVPGPMVKNCSFVPFLDFFEVSK